MKSAMTMNSMSSTACAIIAILLSVTTCTSVSQDVGDREGSREAYATLVTSAEYIIGAEVLAKALRHTNTNRPLVALVGELVPDVGYDVLEDAGYSIVKAPPVVTKKTAVNSPGWPHANTTFCKIHLFGLHEDFDTIVYLDADALPLANLDHLFSLDLSGGHPFAAAPELMPPDTFSTGVMVVRPSAAAHEALLAAAATATAHDGTDQGFFNSVFPDWFDQPADHRLPFAYNVVPSLASYYTPAWDLARPGMQVLHFAGEAPTKPWSFTGAISPSVGLYIYLWQSIARAGRDDDIGPLFDVLSITDEARINALFR